MPIGVVGTTAWALVITVTDPVPRPQISMPYRVAPPVELESEATCREVAMAINEKASEAGVQAKLSAQCNQIEYIEPPEQFKNRSPQS